MVAGTGSRADSRWSQTSLIAEGVGDHAEGFELLAARLAGREVRVGRGAVGLDQGDQGFVVVVALDHDRRHHFVTAVMLM